MPNFLKTRIFGKGQDKTPSRKSSVTTPGSVTTTATAMETPDRNENDDNDRDDDDDEDDSSSGSEQPWDVDDGTDTYDDEDDEDDEETNRSMLSMGKRSLRPLSPPSGAGLLPPKDRRDDVPQREQEDEEDMPMDERKDFQKQQALCGFTDGEGAMGAENLCDYTLTALNGICGISPKGKTSSDKKPSGSSVATATAKPTSKTAAARALMATRLKPPYGVEEQTAIEVEYIEPERKYDSKSDISTSSTGANPRTKQMLVQAMARRAKHEYETQKGRPAQVSSPARDRNNTMESEDSSPNPPDNVYSTFTSSEKRKFLKLINNGLSPMDATKQVLKERNEEDADDGDSSKSSLPYWKRSILEIEADVPQEVAPRPQKKEQFAKSGINYYDAVRKDPGEEWIAEDTPEPVADKQVKKTRRPRLAKFGFFRQGPKGKQLVEERVQEAYPPTHKQTTVPAMAPASPQDLPPALALPQERPAILPIYLPTKSPPRPTNTGTTIPTDDQVLQDLAEVAEASRSIFRPIPSARADALPPSLSQDSLLDDVEEPPAEDDQEEEKNENDVEDEQENNENEEQKEQEKIENDEEAVDVFVAAVEDKEKGNEDEIFVQSASADQTHQYETRKNEPEEDMIPFDTHDRFIAEPNHDTIEDDIAAQLLGVSTPSKFPRSPVRSMATDSLDLDVETTYMNSTEIMSHYNQGTSVTGDLTVKTSGTYGTVGTNYTTSTRSRRPGASKQRLTAQKTGESLGPAQKFKGWQESIQVAAAGIGRVWDPVKGWVDYTDAEEEKKVDDGVFLPVTPQPHPTKVSRQSTEVQEQAPPDSVASPDSLAVLGEETVLEEQAYTHQIHHRAIASPPKPGNAGKKDMTSPVRSRGWIETMKEATARIDTKDKQWDPQRGWVGKDEDQSTENSDRYQGNLHAQALPDTQDFGTIQPPPQLELQESQEGSPNKPLRQTREPSGQQPLHFIRKDPNGQLLQTEDDHYSDIQSVDASTKSGAGGRYIQIGETGSVSSFYHGKTANRTPNRAKSTLLASTPEHMESHKDEDASTSTVPTSGRTSLLVNVKKEKVSHADASMFPEIPKASKEGWRGAGPVDLDKVGGVRGAGPVDLDKVGAVRGPGPVDLDNVGGRRGPGPIDLDEIDDEENGSFGVPQDFSWDDDNFDAASGQGSTSNQAMARMSPSKSVNSRSPTEVSHASTSASSKAVPRLKAPTRDTSPIRGRSASHQAPPPIQQAIGYQNPMAQSASSQSPPSTLSQMRPQQKRFVPDADDSPKPNPNQRGSNVPQDRPQGLRSRPTSPPGSGPDFSPNPADASPSPGNDTRSTHTAESSRSVNHVKELHEYWERRSHGDPVTPPSAEWMSFLSKKVMAESQAAESQAMRGDVDERDSLFDFPESEGAFQRTRKNNSLGASPRQNDAGFRSLEEISNLSPIQNVHDDADDDNETASEVSTNIAQGSTFLQRLQACAAPMMPKTAMDGGMNCNPMPMAHLAFMRSNPAANTGNPEKSKPTSRFIPPTFCGKPDVIVEEDEEENEVNADDEVTRRKTDPSQSWSNTPSGHRQNGDVSSVISDEQFGQKTAYLEAIAMKAAVSGSKKNRRTRSSGSSDASSSKHSESWQRFLDKKRGNGEENDDVPRAAEKYASEKVEEMMGSLAARSRSREFQPRPIEEATGAFPSVGNSNRFKGDDQFQWKNESTRAAEDLAAARVEAMMNALSSPRTLDDGEGEI